MFRPEIASTDNFAFVDRACGVRDSHKVNLAGAEVVWRSNQEAHVAELADALDSGFHFRCFQGVSSRFNKIEKAIDSIAEYALQPRQVQVSIQTPILSQLLSQLLSQFVQQTALVVFAGLRRDQPSSIAVSSNRVSHDLF